MLNQREAMFVRQIPWDLASWERTRAKGRSSLVWRYGVLGWGLPTAIAAAIGFPMLLSASRGVGDATSLGTSCKWLAISLLLFPPLGPLIANVTWFEGERAYLASVRRTKPAPRTYPRWMRWVFRIAIGTFALLAFLVTGAGSFARELAPQPVPDAFASWGFAAPLLLWGGAFGWLLLTSSDMPPEEENRVEASGRSAHGA